MCGAFETQKHDFCKSKWMIYEYEPAIKMVKYITEV